MRRAVKGFTMVELVVAVAIVLILVAVAFASYQDYMTRKARTEASTIMVELSKWLTQQRVNSSGFQFIRLPYTQIPLEGAPRYQLSILQADMLAADPKVEFPAVSELTFTLRADPVADDACGGLLLDQNGRRGVTGAGARVEDCWSN